MRKIWRTAQCSNKFLLLNITANTADFTHVKLKMAFFVSERNNHSSKNGLEFNRTIFFYQ